MLQGCRAWLSGQTSRTCLRAAWGAHPLQGACRFGSQTAGAAKDAAWSHRAFLTLAGVGLGSAFAVNKESSTARSAEGKSQSLCVVGEALFDFLPAKLPDGQQAFLPRPGGAPFNVCLAAKRLGADVSYLGALSTDMFGEELHKTLQSEKVDMSMAPRVPNPSTLAFVSKPPGADVRYAFFKDNAADRTLTARTVGNALAAKSFAAVHVSMGAITLEDTSMEQAFQEAFNRVHAAGGFTAFDPNLRGPMIKGSSADYAGKVEAFARHCDCVKSSDADVEFLYGAGVDLEAVAKKWLQQGPKIVVITRGPDGATAWFRQGKNGPITSLSALPPCKPPMTIDAKGQQAPVVDTVGAGDTCMGALLCGFLGKDGGKSLRAQLVGSAPFDEAAALRLREIMFAAVTAAAINVSRAGCDPPTAPELQQVVAARR